MWTAAQALGIITWILVDKNNNLYKDFVVGGLFIIITVIDIFYFRMYPAEENIFVEDPEKRRKEKQIFDSMNQTLKLNDATHISGQKMNIYKLSRAESLSNLKITYLMPFVDSKIIILILSRGFRMSASMLSL